MIETIMELIRRQFGIIMNNDEEYYANYKIYLSNEQQFVKEKDRERGAIYIVVKFLQASLNFGQNVMPVTISAIAERNKLDVCQKLLLEFAQTYNLTKNDDETIIQTYTSPTIASNFNEIFDGFRSLFMMSGTFLISDTANPYEIYYKFTTDDTEEYQKLQCISTSANFDVQLDSQAFASDNFSKSIGMIGILSVNVVIFLTENDMTDAVLAIISKDYLTQPDGVNAPFYLKITFKNGIEITSEFKLTNFSAQQNVGEMPVASITFTN